MFPGFVCPEIAALTGSVGMEKSCDGSFLSAVAPLPPNLRELGPANHRVT